jgi:hypothetical protein
MGIDDRNAGRSHRGRTAAPSEHRAAWCHFYGGDAPAEQDDEAVAVAGAEHPRVLGQRRDGMLGDLVRIGCARFVVTSV